MSTAAGALAREMWTRGECAALALTGCTRCLGTGKPRSDKPCLCVLRAVFRQCYMAWKKYVQQDRSLSIASYGRVRTKPGPAAMGRRMEEYIADFELIAKWTLSDGQLKLFRYHYLLGADWKLCTRKAGIDRGTFFRERYRIEAALGRAYRETQPYGLWPVDEYFGSVRTEPVKSAPVARQAPALGVRTN